LRVGVVWLKDQDSTQSLDSVIVFLSHEVCVAEQIQIAHVIWVCFRNSLKWFDGFDKLQISAQCETVFADDDKAIRIQSQ
jgi:hypothetical protein